MPSEFSLIERYFNNIGKSDHSPTLGNGDDAAVVNVPEGKQMVMSVDTLIAGVHFPETTSAHDIAHKALAVNLSDLAAMAASPAWFLLSLTLPEVDKDWLSEFSGSLKETAEQYEIELIGGDTCQGPLSVTIQVNGLVDSNKFITRSGAQVGDQILVSGQLGNAAMGLAVKQKKIYLTKELEEVSVHALNRPTPRLCLASFLQTYANAAIDISDGLVGDLKHILDKGDGDIGAIVRRDDLPVNDWIKQNNTFEFALNGGDDYELCFTVPPCYDDAICLWNQANPDCPLSIIGEITESDYHLIENGNSVDLNKSKGYQHFGT